MIENLCEKIRTQFNCRCEYYTGILNDETLKIPPGWVKDVIILILDEFNCAHLSTITAQQRESQPEVIEVIYHFFKDAGFSLWTSIPSKNPQLPSIISHIPGADFYEREVAEMFGVKFTGREETPPLLLPDDWDQGPPFMKKEVKDD